MLPGRMGYLSERSIPLALLSKVLNAGPSCLLIARWSERKIEGRRGGSESREVIEDSDERELRLDTDGDVVREEEDRLG